MDVKLETGVSSFTGRYHFLSNFYLTPIKLDGWTYPSVEHAYQASKAAPDAVMTCIGPNREVAVRLVRDVVCCAATPGQAKRLGGDIELRPDWEALKVPLMHELVRQKFLNPVLRQMLIDTGIADLIEGNWWGDTFWGVCKGVGQNHLGKILMKVRYDIQTSRELPWTLS